MLTPQSAQLEDDLSPAQNRGGDAVDLQHARRRNRYPASPAASRVPQAAERPINRLAVMTCLFNPQRYVRIRSNFERFASHIAEFDVDLWTIELALDDDDFSLPDCPRTIRVRGQRDRHTLWQKERLLNLLLGAIPNEYDGIGWFDGDVLLTNRFWVEAVRATLRQYVWCQPFINSWWQDAAGGLTSLKRSAGWSRHFQPEVYLDVSRVHPGFAWFARAAWLRQHGLYDRNPTGGGDSLMLKASSSSPLLVDRHLTPAWRADVDSWAKSARSNGGGSLGFTPGDVVHLYHGTRSNRRYVQRWTYLSDDAYDPARDLEIDPDNGLLRWSRLALVNKPRMVLRVSDYFRQRQEDD